MYALVFKNEDEDPTEMVINIKQGHSVQSLQNGVPYKAMFDGKM